VTNTCEAIEALARCAVLSHDDAAALREAHAFLRKLEQRLHVVHATSIHLIEAEAPGLVPLARRMGFRDEPGSPAAAQLLSEYARITSTSRETYLRLLGV
jgi:glutamate-ammonia-ligase adenylyltransferase